jgi:hypothetical protein
MAFVLQTNTEDLKIALFRACAMDEKRKEFLLVSEYKTLHMLKDMRITNMSEIKPLFIHIEYF